MKILIASDIHGSYYWLKKLLKVFNSGKFDKMILLGDIYYHGPRNPLPKDYNPIEVSKELNKLKEKLIVIKGNCDAEVDEMISDFKFYKNKKMKINNKNVFLTHGHNFNIDNLPKVDFNIMLYGHLHEGFIFQKNNKLFINPGSISLPKNKSKNSYIVFENNIISIFDFDGNILNKIVL